MKLLIITPFPNSPSATQRKLLGELAHSIKLHLSLLSKSNAISWVVCSNAEGLEIEGATIIPDPTLDSMVEKRRHLISTALGICPSWDLLCWLDADDLVTKLYANAIRFAIATPTNLCCLHGVIADTPSDSSAYFKYQRWCRTNANEALSRGENPFTSGSCLVWKPTTPPNILLGESVGSEFAGVEDVCWAYFSKESAAKIEVRGAVLVRPSISYYAITEMDRVVRRNLIRKFYKDMGYYAYNQIGYVNESG